MKVHSILLSIADRKQGTKPHICSRGKGSKHFIVKLLIALLFKRTVI